MLENVDILVCSILLIAVIIVGAIMLWKEIKIKNIKEKEDVAIKALCDDYNEGLKRREHEISINKERPEINLNR